MFCLNKIILYLFVFAVFQFVVRSFHHKYSFFHNLDAVGRYFGALHVVGDDDGRRIVFFAYFQYQFAYFSGGDGV